MLNNSGAAVTIAVVPNAICKESGINGNELKF